MSQPTASATKPRPTKKTSAPLSRPDNRALILETTEQLMRNEGYAAVSTRRVAKEAGLKPPLIHYYFPTTDDLFLAVFRYAANKEMQKLTEAVDTSASLQSIWTTYCNQDQTALAIEFMALANHRKAIKDEIATLTQRERRRRAEILTSLIDKDSLKNTNCSALGLNVLLIGVARTLVMERGLGITLGHDDAASFVEHWLAASEKNTD